MNRGHLFVLSTAVISGVSVFANSLGVAQFDPFVFTTLKNAVVAVALLSLLWLGGQSGYLKSLKANDWKKLFAIGIVGGSAPFLLFFWGLANSSAASAGFIHKTMFVWVSALAFVFLKERLTRLQLAGALALLAGVFVFSGLPLAFGMGELAILAATLLWSAETVISKRALATVRPGVVAAARMGFGLVVLLPFTAATSGFPALSLPQLGWLALTSALLLGYAWTWYNGLALVKASEAAALLLLGSVLTSALSWAILGKALQLATGAGIALMLIGLSGMAWPSLEALKRVHRVPCESALKK